MKRLVVNAFCPKEHKVISSLVTETDLPPRDRLAIRCKIREVRTRVLKGHRIISGCSEAWYRAWFGTRRSWVQIPPARFQSTAVAERSPRRQAVGSNPTSAIEPYALRLYCALSSAHLLVRSRPATPLRTTDTTALGLDPCVKHRNPKKTGVWHKRLYTVIVEVNPFSPCIPLLRS